MEELKLRPSQICALRCLYDVYVNEDTSGRSLLETNHNLRVAVKEVLDSFQTDFSLGA